MVAVVENSFVKIVVEDVGWVVCCIGCWHTVVEVLVVGVVVVVVVVQLIFRPILFVLLTSVPSAPVLLLCFFIFRSFFSSVASSVV